MSSQLVFGKVGETVQLRLQAVFADEVLEKFFGQTRQRSGGNFYFDLGDVAAAKTVNFQNLLKIDLLPVGNNESGCSICMDSVDDDNPEILLEYTVQDTQSFLHCDKTL